MSQTILKFYREPKDSQCHIPFASARGCHQSLEPATQLKTFRTLCGQLLSFPSFGHTKYRSTIACEDVYAVALDGFHPGTKIWVECIAALMTPWDHKNQKIELARTPVDDSLWLHTQETQPTPLPMGAVQDRWVTLPEDGYISYRPFLYMLVEEFLIRTQEWEGSTGWSMKLSEI